MLNFCAVGEEVVLDVVDAPRDVDPSTLGHANDADVDGRSDSGRISDGNADEVMPAGILIAREFALFLAVVLSAAVSSGRELG
jgi:hypothetical protein